jgi:AcrR family transcriptional regulator
VTEGYDNEMTSMQTSIAEAASRGATRRRGAQLEDAILAAGYDELVEAGYTAFSVEGVAARAGTGKASIYRRWPSKQHLVMDVLDSQLPTPEQCGVSFSIDDLDDALSTADVLRLVATNIAQVMASPAGDAMRAVKCEALADPQLAKLVDQRFQAPRRAALLALLRRGVARGEVRPEAVTQTVADVLPAVLSYRVLMQREQVSAADITEIMDQVLIPLVTAH